MGVSESEDELWAFAEIQGGDPKVFFSPLSEKKERHSPLVRSGREAWTISLHKHTLSPQSLSRRSVCGATYLSPTPPAMLPHERRPQLAREMRSVAARSSSALSIEAARSALAGVEPGARPAVARRRRADEARVHQLRGVFAAYDADGDGRLTLEQLRMTLLALGLQPAPALLNLFVMPPLAGEERPAEEELVDLQTVSTRAAWGVGAVGRRGDGRGAGLALLRGGAAWREVRVGGMPLLTGDALLTPMHAHPPPPSLQFVRTIMLVVPEMAPPGAPSTEGAIMDLFHLMDPDKTGSVPVSVLIHLLAGVSSPSRLSYAEVRWGVDAAWLRQRASSCTPARVRKRVARKRASHTGVETCSRPRLLPLPPLPPPLPPSPPCAPSLGV